MSPYRAAIRRGRPAGAVFAVALAAAIMVADVVEGPKTQYVGLLVGPPFLAASFVAAVPTFAVGMCSLALGAAYGAYEGVGGTEPQVFRLVLIGIAAVMAAGVAHLRVSRERAMAQLTTVAEVTQRAMLREVPAQLGPARLAVHYASASAAARIGGDLYEVVETPFGLRLLIGDVRGKGLDAVRLASDVLGAFRFAAFQRPSLVEVVGDLDVTVQRGMRDEDFVTVLLAELDRSGRLVLVNCGHPPPLRLHGATPQLLVPPSYTGPLGLFPQPEAMSVTLAPGERLLFYTDGLTEARRGDAFFPLLDLAPSTLGEGSLDAGLRRLRTAAEKFARGQLDDDIAMIAVELVGAADRTAAAVT